MDIKGIVDKTEWTVSQREIDDLLHSAVATHMKPGHGWTQCSEGWCKGSQYFRISLHHPDNVFFFELWDVEYGVRLLWDFKILKLDAASLEKVLFGLGI
jgi:hypothetical protein